MINRDTLTYIKETISPFILPYNLGITVVLWWTWNVCVERIYNIYWCALRKFTTIFDLFLVQPHVERYIWATSQLWNRLTIYAKIHTNLRCFRSRFIQIFFWSLLELTTREKLMLGTIMKYIYMYVWCMHKGTKYIVFNMIYFNTNSLIERLHDNDICLLARVDTERPHMHAQNWHTYTS
jgi:hypothetical protein